MPPPLPGAQLLLDQEAVLARFRAGVREALDALPPAWMVGVMWVLMSLTIVLIPRVIRARRDFAKASGFARQARAMLLPWLDRAKFRMAFPVMVTSHLRRPVVQPATGLFLVGETGDPTIGQVTDIMDRIENPPADLTDGDRRAIRGLLNDEEFNFRRWRRVPASISGGVSIYALDLAVHPLFLFGHHLADDCPFVPIAVDPAPGGLAIVLPYWFISGSQPTPEEQEAMTMMLMGMPQLEEK